MVNAIVRVYDHHVQAVYINVKHCIALMKALCI